MTEEVGFSPEPEPAPELAEAAEAEQAAPEAELEPDAAPEEPVPDETPAPAGPPEAAPAAPDHVPPPFIPEQGVAGWQRELYLEFHRRLRALGG